MRSRPMPNSSVTDGMFGAEDLAPVPLSYLSQYGYCPRRCGLIALEGLWCDNQYTAQGSAAHGRVHTARVEKRGKQISLFEFPVFSHALGLSGFCDCVELHESEEGVPLPFGAARYAVYPVEYKHGAVRDEAEYHLQLCAQALCLEEMFGCRIPSGAVFFTGAHGRDEVMFADALRRSVGDATAAVREMLREQRVPAAAYSAKCRKCSMAEVCLPSVKKQAGAYIRGLWREAAGEEDVG